MRSLSLTPAEPEDSDEVSIDRVDLLLTGREAAALLRCGVSTFHRWVTLGLVGQPLKLGGTSRWPRSEILAVIEAAKAKRTSSPNA